MGYSAATMNPMRWLLSKWHARLRHIDTEILWPSCRDQASDLDHAKDAFAAHAFHDHAWASLGEAEVYRIIDGLE
jgi:hypothetical protein